MGWPGQLTGALGIRWPIIQGPFGGFRSEALVAEVSNFGGLGSIGANAMQPDEITHSIANVRARTDKPFAVNLWVSTEDPGASDVAAAASVTDSTARARRALSPTFEEFGLPPPRLSAPVAPLAPIAASVVDNTTRALVAVGPRFAELGLPAPRVPAYAPMSFAAQVRAVLDANVPVFSFIVGIPPRDILDECRDRKILTIGTATTPDEAVALAAAGVTAIVASGFEAGGHRGSFLAPAEDSMLGTFSLVPQVVDVARGIPVIAAGGVADGRTVQAAFALGAAGVQIGTRLLACEGSGASLEHRTALRTGRFTPTVLSAGFTGRYARGLANQLARDVQTAPYLPYPLQRSLIKELTTAAAHAHRADLAQQWSGQSAGVGLASDSATAVLQSIIDFVTT
ncbi:MAG TPA: nitronate monooxygenase [Kofleriaceae bacterium]|jgi:nitronate monooxygenase